MWEICCNFFFFFSKSSFFYLRCIYIVYVYYTMLYWDVARVVYAAYGKRTNDNIDINLLYVCPVLDGVQDDGRPVAIWRYFRPQGGRLMLGRGRSTIRKGVLRGRTARWRFVRRSSLAKDGRVEVGVSTSVFAEINKNSSHLLHLSCVQSGTHGDTRCARRHKARTETQGAHVAHVCPCAHI